MRIFIGQFKWSSIHSCATLPFMNTVRKLIFINPATYKFITCPGYVWTSQYVQLYVAVAWETWTDVGCQYSQNVTSGKHMTSVDWKRLMTKSRRLEKCSQKTLKGARLRPKTKSVLNARNIAVVFDAQWSKSWEDFPEFIKKCPSL